MNPNVTIIILNWNGWQDTIECLESVFQNDYPNYNVIVVDNDSTDDSINRIKKYCSNRTNNPSRINNPDTKVSEYEEKYFNSIHLDVEEEKNTNKSIILKNSKNYGYAKGNNIGMKFALKFFNPDYILLLNNDTIVDKDFLKELIKAVEKHEMVGIFAPKILNANDPDIIDSAGHIFSWGRIVDRGSEKVDKNQYDAKTEVIGAKGAACLYKCEMLESIGLFKEDLVTLYEDAELSWRANKNSWKAIYVPKSIIYHKIGRSIKKEDSKLLYFQRLGIKNITLTVKEYGTLDQKMLFIFVFLNLIISYTILACLINYREFIRFMRKTE
ncbi:MAG: N-glycosyltransferase [Methanobacterium sp. PtaB.Bin024]|nr:MAG: N-glycosyltransferase [Methanobacterium sp. PtaB.Bin024]